MSSPGSLAGLRVLVVEDEMLVSLLVEELLIEQSCVVVGPFSRIGEALEAARTRAFDVALLDVNVDGAKIYPVAEAISGRGIPFLLLSGYGDAAIPVSHPEWRACAKPFKADVLISMLIEQIARPH